PPSTPPANLAAAREALKSLIEEPERVQAVMKNAKKLKDGLLEMGWQVGPSESPILPGYVGKDLTAMLLWRDLVDAGVYVNTVLYPAVDRDQARLRVSTIATHTDQHISQALEAFEMVGKSYGLLQKHVMNATR